MEYVKVKKILDDFTYKNEYKKRYSRKVITEQYGQSRQEADGVLYVWPNPINLDIRRETDDNREHIIFSGGITSLKLKSDSISFTMFRRPGSKPVSDDILEVVEWTENKTLLTSFGKMELTRWYY